jgi:hypothetical protein
MMKFIIGQPRGRLGLLSPLLLLAFVVCTVSSYVIHKQFHSSYRSLDRLVSFSCFLEVG